MENVPSVPGFSVFPCPYLKGAVELTKERERHITERHPVTLISGYMLI